MYSWFLETTTWVNYFYFAHCSFLWSVFLTFLSQNLIKAMPLMPIYHVQFLVMQLKKSCVWQTTLKKSLAVHLSNCPSQGRHGVGGATYSLFWLFLLLPLRIFIPVWYIISASCICRLSAASSSAKNKMSDALKWTLTNSTPIIYQTSACTLPFG